MQTTLSELAGLKALYLETLTKHRSAAADNARLAAKLAATESALAAAEARNLELHQALAAPTTPPQSKPSHTALLARNNELTAELNNLRTELMLANLEVQKLRIRIGLNSATAAASPASP